MLTKFEFDVNFQRALLRLCMIDEAFNHKCQEYLDDGCFTTEPLGWVYKIMQQHYTQYRVCCGDIPLSNALNYVDATKRAGYSVEVNYVIAYGVVPAGGYVKDRLQEFVQRNMFVHMHKQAADLFNKGKTSESYDLTRRGSDEIHQVDFNAPDRSWFYDELQQRQSQRALAYMDPTKGTYTTGIAELDDILDGGIHQGELFFVMALAKVGKTTWLINQGFAASFVSRVPTLHVNLEGTTQQLTDKYDSCCGGETYKKVKAGDISPAIHAKMMAEYQYLRKNLVIRTMNDWNPTVMDIQAELDTLKALGFVPEVIIVDYLDILRSRDAKAGTGETEHQVGASRDLKRLANKGYAIWSACQAQRPKKPGFDEEEGILRSSDIADAYAKIRVADGYGSLNATRKERENNTCRLFWEGYRAAPVGKLFRLQNDNARMSMAKDGRAEIIPMGAPTSGP